MYCDFIQPRQRTSQPGRWSCFRFWWPPRARQSPAAIVRRRWTHLGHNHHVQRPSSGRLCAVLGRKMFGSSAESVGESAEESHPLTTGSSSLFWKVDRGGVQVRFRDGCPKVQLVAACLTRRKADQSENVPLPARSRTGHREEEPVGRFRASEFNPSIVATSPFRKTVYAVTP